MAEIMALPSQITEVITIATEVFREITGVYLYGSATLGGLHPSSDIDILIIVSEALTPCARKKLTARLMSVSGLPEHPAKRPLEVTVLLQSDIIPFGFPPRYEYLYGEWLRPQLEAGNIPQPSHNPDLAILLWQARQHSVTLMGVDAEKLIPPIPFSVIQMAIRDSLPGLLDWLKGDERNVLLTLARMWFTLETGDICSKDAAAEWVCQKLPNSLSPLLEMARAAYLGKIQDKWSNVEKDTLLVADFMRKRIEALA